MLNEFIDSGNDKLNKVLKDEMSLLIEFVDSCKWM